MSKIINFINCFFSLEWKLQQKIMEIHLTKSELINRINRICAISLIIISCFVVLILKQFNTVSFIIFGVLVIFYFLTDFISKSLKALTTVSGFFTTGLVTIIIIFLLILAALIENHEVISSLNEDIILNDYIKFDYAGYVFALVTFAVIWNLFSSLCNAKVATVCNAILTAIVTIILEFKNLIFLFLPNKLGFFNEVELAEIETLGYSEIQLFELAISLFIFPIFATLGVATMVCAIKSYWVKNCNKGRDIENIENETDLQNENDEEKPVMIEQSNN